MAFYRVQYEVDEDGAYQYPPSVEYVVWSSLVYDPKKSELVGESDDELKSGEGVERLPEEKGARLMEEIRRALPKPETAADPGERFAAAAADSPPESWPAPQGELS